jgi:lipopolysaccharide transport protein LptA
MRRAGLGLAVGVLLAAAAAHADGVGVARFEVVPSGEAALELGAQVAQRLATRGIGRVAGPSELGVAARYEASAEEAREWARKAGVDALVVGRTTRVGSGLSVHARVLDGPSGKPVGAPVIEEAARPEDVGRTIDRLTGSLIDRLAKRPGAVSAPPVADPAEKPATPDREKPAGADRMGASFDRGKPLSIQSDQLESQTDAKGARRILFTGHVRATQGDLSLLADRVEAVSSAGNSEPDRLTARGHVTLKQGTRTARCAEAVFHRREERVVCTGQLAEIEQGCDRVRGPKIVFHLGSERLEVEGGADVQIRPDAPGCGVASSPAGGQGG